MRILTLNANLKGIGTYQRCFYFSRELARLGHDVTMVTVSRQSLYRPRVSFKRDWVGEESTAIGPGPWIRLIEGPQLGYKWLPGWGSGPLDLVHRTKELAFGNYDAVYGFEYQPNVSWPVYLTRRLRPYRFFSDWCDWYSGASNTLRGIRLAHKVDAFFEERIRYRAEKVTVISAVLEQRALSLGLARDRVVLLPNGIDTTYIQPYPRSECRERLGLPPSRPILVAVNDGDMERVVRIHHELLRFVPDALAVIVGKVNERAKSLAASLGVSNGFHWAGWVSDEDYPRYFAASDLCFLPLKDSLHNRARFPAKLLDFLASGRSVVTNDVGAVGSLVNRGNVGIAVNQDDHLLVTALAELLNEPGRRKEMGERARHLMTSQWDWGRRTGDIARVLAA